MKFTTYILLALVIFSCTPKPKNPGTGMNYFSGTLDEAIKKATEENKRIFIFGHTDWCGYCRKMEKSTLMEKEVNEYMNEKFINLSYDLEKGEGISIAGKYGLKSYPAYVILSPSGELQDIALGYLNTTRFLSWVKATPD